MKKLLIVSIACLGLLGVGYSQVDIDASCNLGEEGQIQCLHHHELAHNAGLAHLAGRSGTAESLHSGLLSEHLLNAHENHI